MLTLGYTSPTFYLHLTKSWVLSLNKSLPPNACKENENSTRERANTLNFKTVHTLTPFRFSPTLLSSCTTTSAAFPCSASARCRTFRVKLRSHAIALSTCQRQAGHGNKQVSKCGHKRQSKRMKHTVFPTLLEHVPSKFPGQHSIKWILKFVLVRRFWAFGGNFCTAWFEAQCGPCVAQIVQGRQSACLLQSCIGVRQCQLASQQHFSIYGIRHRVPRVTR